MYVYMYCALCTAGWGMYGSGQTDCFARASTQRRYIEDSSHLVQSLLRTIDDGGSYLILFLLEVCGTVGPSIPLTVKVSRWVVCWKYEIVGGSYWSLSSIGRKFLSAKEFKSVFFFFFSWSLRWSCLGLTVCNIVWSSMWEYCPLALTPELWNLRWLRLWYGNSSVPLASCFEIFGVHTERLSLA